MAKTFEAFRNKKSCRAKDYAIEIVMKMYRLDQQERAKMKSECQVDWLTRRFEFEFTVKVIFLIRRT